MRSASNAVDAQSGQLSNMTSSAVPGVVSLIVPPGVALTVSIVMGTIVRRGSAASAKGSAATLARMENQTVDTQATDDVIEVQDELLVEEISIDGMCGVY